MAGNSALPQRCQVAVVGGGPAGLAAATRLAQLGVRDVLVLERESRAGGVPRHCGHPPFGLREFGRCYTGPRYAARLVARARDAGVSICTEVTVVALHEGGKLTLSSDAGEHQLEADRVILSTGVRETPRSARLVSGVRPVGVMTTGALQSMVYLQGKLPCRRPLIVGTELVSFSALLTCRHAGIKPAAMIEAKPRITAWRGSTLLPRVLGIPVFTETRIEEILGDERVDAVRVSQPGDAPRRIDCDAVVFSGQFVPEATLCRMSHLSLDPATGGPRVDQYGRCSDPTYFATGNLLRPVETAGWCWREGVRTGEVVADELRNQAVATAGRYDIKIDSEPIRYVMPGAIATAQSADARITVAPLQIRLSEAAAGTLTLRCGTDEITRTRVNSRPERRVLMRVPPFSLTEASGAADEPHFSLSFLKD